MGHTQHYGSHELFVWVLRFSGSHENLLQRVFMLGRVCCQMEESQEGADPERDYCLFGCHTAPVICDEGVPKGTVDTK